jgi:phosphatidylglycerol:prolipoprotein diacylglycerol transferase
MLPAVLIAGRSLPVYGLLAAAGAAAALACMLARCRRFGLSREDAAYIAAFGGVGALAGGKLLYLLLSLPALAADLPLLLRAPGEFLARWGAGGMVYYGGLAGCVLGAAWAARQYGVRTAAVWPAAMPALALGHAITRVGCFCAGCCYGVENAVLGIRFSASPFAPRGVPLLPVQLYEAAAELCIFCFLLWYTARPRRVGALAAYVLCYAPVRFVLEFWRGDAVRGAFAGLSTGQWCSLAALALAGVSLLRARAAAKS